MTEQVKAGSTMYSRFVLLIIIAALMIAIPGCTEKEVLPEPEIPTHFTTYTDEEALFSISYPPDWEPALYLIEGIEDAVKEVITSIESDVPLEGASIIFLAGLPTEIGYDPSVTIVVESLPGIVWTHDNMVEAEVRGIKQSIPDYHEFSRLKTTVGGREATIVESDGTFPGGEKSHNLQMYILVGKTAWIVTCGTSIGDFNRWEADLSAVVRSLRILN